jgi:Spy/CpxP family protein refolding chaperone
MKMKRSWLILFGGLLAGLIAYTCIYLHASSIQLSMEQAYHPEIAWLKNEYHLTDTQFVQVAQLHDAYRPKCAEMCRRIDDENAKVQQLLSETNIVTPEIKLALTEAAQLRVECQSAMMQHFYEVSRAMPPEQGKRYLTWVQQETLLPGQMVPTQPAMKMDRK